MSTPENKQPLIVEPLAIEANPLDPSANRSVGDIAATALAGAGALYLGAKGFESGGAEAAAVAPISKEAIANTIDSTAVATIGLRKAIAARRLESAEKRTQDNEDDILPAIARNNWRNSPAIGPDHPHSPSTKQELRVANKVGRVKTRTHKRQAEIRRMERVLDVPGENDNMPDYKKRKREEKQKINGGVVYIIGKNGRPNLGTGIDPETGKPKNKYTPPPPEKEYVGSEEHAEHIATARMLPSEKRSNKRAYRSARRKRGEGIIGTLNPRNISRDSRRVTRYFDPQEVERQAEHVKNLEERQKQRRERIEKRRQAAIARKTK